MPGRIQDRTALITGTSSGLGRSIALKLASEGARICCADLHRAPRVSTDSTTGKAASVDARLPYSEDTLGELQRLHGAERAIFVPTDVRVAGDVEAAVRKCVEVFGRLDILCCNAGISIESTQVRGLGVHELGEAEWDATMAVNVRGVFLCCKYGIGQMLKQQESGSSGSRGWIVNTASVQGLVAYHNTPAYTASKGAVAQLTKQIALDYSPHRIHCNAICPGFLRTTMTQNLQNDAALRAEMDSRHPLGGMGDPDEVAKAVLFLASDDVGWVQGVNLPVDGGYMIM